jgi:hypothetical protein
VSKRWVTNHGTRTAVLGLITLTVYAVLAPPWIVEGDNAELAGLSVLGGAAHPTGYPLYVLWLRAWSWLPAHSAAHAAALATALLTAIEVMLVDAAARAWGARPAAATLVAALVAASPVVMRVQSQAEVFALNGAIVAAVLWLAANAGELAARGGELAGGGPLRGERRVIALALVAGLGLANHLTCAFVAPIGVLGVVRGFRETARPRALVAALGVAALIIGVLPYAYLLVAPSTAMSWGKIATLGDLVHHVLRIDYGGPSQLGPHGTHVAAVDSLWALARTLGRAFLWLPIAAAAFAWKARSETRAAWLCWLASFVIAGPLFVARFNLPPAGLELYTVSRFHLLPMVLLAIPIAVGLTWLAERLPARSPVIVGVVIAAIAGADVLVSYPQVARYHTAAVQRSLENMLTSLPPNAIVIGTQDILLFGAGYLQAVDGVRPDVTVIMTPQLGVPFYRARITQKTGVDLAPMLTSDTPSVRLAELMLATGRPVFIDQFQGNIAKSFPVTPFGAVFRVLPRGATVPPIEELFATNKALYEKFRFDYPTPRPADDLAAQAHAQYAAVWRALAGGLVDPEHRAYADAMAHALAPQ